MTEDEKENARKRRRKYRLKPETKAKEKAYRQEYERNNKDERNRKIREHNNSPENHERILQSQREYKLKVKYGLSIDEYNRLYQEQNGCCAICGTNEHDISRQKLFVDHCHTTNSVRA